MARTTIQLKFNGEPDFPLDITLGYRQFIRHVFKTTGELLDVTDIASAGELNRDPHLAALVAAGTFTVVVTAGSSDIAGSDVTLSSVTPAAVGSAAASAGVSTAAARADHVHIDANASVTAVKAGVLDASLMGIELVMRIPITSGGATGTADDVTIFSTNAPFKFRVLGASMYISTAGAVASTATLRGAAAGAGTQYSGAIDTSALGVTRASGTTPTVTSTVAAGGSLFLRRVDRSTVGELIITLVRET